MQQNLISSGNTKLGAIPNFNISTFDTCLNMPCLKYCYAHKIEKRYPNVRKKWHNNYLETLKPGFVNRIINEIHNNYSIISVFRIHSGGRMYSQKYFNKWLKIAANVNNMKFYTYEKTLLDYSKRPKNLIIHASNDCGTMSQQTINKFDGECRILFKGDKPVTGFKMCPSNCISCGKCWQKGTNIQFKKH